MIISIISKDKIKTVSLPKKVKGQFWFEDPSDIKNKRLVCIEGIEDQWILKSAAQTQIRDQSGEALKSIVLQSMAVYLLEAKGREGIYVYTEPTTNDRQCYTKFTIQRGTSLSIGRAEGNDIRYKNNFVSSKHAVLLHQEQNWYIRDTDSANGVFVNQKRVQEGQLFLGDVVYIMGMKIVIGTDFIAVNNPDHSVFVSGQLSLYTKQEIQVVEEDEEYEEKGKTYFYRLPRFKRDIEKETISIDPPPDSPVTEELPMVLVLGSSLAMGIMSLVTVTNAIIKQNIISMVMGSSMLIGTVLLPIISKKYDAGRKRKREALRQKRYREYLSEEAAQIGEKCTLQEEILHENYVSIQECERRILERTRNLWERGCRQNDFLRIRIGHGEGVLEADIPKSGRRFTLDSDSLREEYYALLEEPKTLHDIPITYSMFEEYISAIVGQRGEVTEFVKGLIMQCAAFYGYDEVKFVFIYDEEECAVFDFVKWLPHVWSEGNKFRFVATTLAEVKEISAYLEPIVSGRAAMNATDLEDAMPYYIIFSMSKELAERAEVLKEILSQKQNIHFSIVTAYGDLKSLPKESSMVVELNGSVGRLFDKNDITGQSVEFIPDIRLDQDPYRMAVQLANVQLDILSDEEKLPQSISFMEMFEVGRVEHLNALNRWKENDPTKSLAAPIGVNTLGDIFTLDLHEKFHGPHGLVAGMTGSGKSEFIITYILSLAVSYHPNEVAFILIDYKGGGMAKSFERLPHTAGIITNLDGSAIKRSLISIESELKRRQAIFAEVSKKINVSNIDIYKYQKLYRDGTVEEPLQHLFIISDEFAELKTQQPEFMAQLVSAARIGRSLGVHLILATQKPSGVVDDQIWSNSKFRVCLKVQDRADSMDMLKRPEAAELTTTGRFYLQVGYNELFELGQSAWAGAPYYPSDRAIIAKDNSVVIVDKNGHTVKEGKIDNRGVGNTSKQKQLDAITEYLCQIAMEENIKIRPLWLEPIPAIILIEDIKEKYKATSKRYELNPVVGEYDDPVHQRQCLFRVPVSQEGNVIIYGSAGCGKTTFLNAFLYSLIAEHTAEEVAIYIMDFATETLRAFSKAPQVGDVMLSYEKEKITNLMKMLYKALRDRKKLFADYGGDYQAYIGAGNDLAQIVVVINNYTAFTEEYEELEEAVAFLSREGVKYGIYFVITSVSTSGVRFRMVQNFKQLFTLQLNDEAEYSSIVGKTEGLFPAKYKGRGLVRLDMLYEFQIASLTDEGVPYSFIQQYVEQQAKSWHGTKAPKVAVLPELVNEEFLQEYIVADEYQNIPVGVETNSLNISRYPFGAAYISMVVSADDRYQEFADDFTSMVEHCLHVNGYILDGENTITAKVVRLKKANSKKQLDDMIEELFDMTLYRNNAYKDSLEANEEPPIFEPQLIIISSLLKIRQQLSETNVTKLNLILEKGEAKYGMHIILMEQSKALGTMTMEPWFKSKVSQTDGIWIGAGVTDQYTLKATKQTSEMREMIGKGYGYVFKKGKVTKIKVLRSGSGEDDDE